MNFWSCCFNDKPTGGGKPKANPPTAKQRKVEESSESEEEPEFDEEAEDTEKEPSLSDSD